MDTKAYMEAANAQDVPGKCNVCYCDIVKPRCSKDSSVVRAPDSLLKDSGFKSLQEWGVNFLLLGQLSVLTLILVSIPLTCYCSGTYKVPVVSTKSINCSRLQLNTHTRCQKQVTAKHTYKVPVGPPKV